MSFLHDDVNYEKKLNNENDISNDEMKTVNINLNEGENYLEKNEYCEETSDFTKDYNLLPVDKHRLKQKYLPISPKENTVVSKGKGIGKGLGLIPGHIQRLIFTFILKNIFLFKE
jgi:hypothetical protein